jgi:hypothetical protein
MKRQPRTREGRGGKARELAARQACHLKPRGAPRLRNAAAALQIVLPGCDSWIVHARSTAGAGCGKAQRGAARGGGRPPCAAGRELQRSAGRRTAGVFSACGTSRLLPSTRTCHATPWWRSRVGQLTSPPLTNPASTGRSAHHASETAKPGTAHPGRDDPRARRLASRAPTIESTPVNAESNPAKQTIRPGARCADRPAGGHSAQRLAIWRRNLVCGRAWSARPQDRRVLRVRAGGDGRGRWMPGLGHPGRARAGRAQLRLHGRIHEDGSRPFMGRHQKLCVVALLGHHG